MREYKSLKQERIERQKWKSSDTGHLLLAVIFAFLCWFKTHGTDGVDLYHYNMISCNHPDLPPTYSCPKGTRNHEAIE